MKINVSPDVYRFQKVPCPPDFFTLYKWDNRIGGLVQCISKPAIRLTNGWYSYGYYYWDVGTLSSKDLRWLNLGRVTGNKVITLLSESVPDWSRRNVHITSDVKTSEQALFRLLVRHVERDAVELEISWNVSPDEVRAIMDVDDYVYSHGWVLPGIAPARLLETLSCAQGLCTLTGEQIPLFVESLPLLGRFMTPGSIAQIKEHHGMHDHVSLELMAYSQRRNGIGDAYARLRILSDGDELELPELRQGLSRFIRVKGGWLTNDALRASGLYQLPSDRFFTLTHGPVHLDETDIVLGRSDRVDGPWGTLSIDHSDWIINLDRRDPARSHIDWICKWGLGGGYVGSKSDGTTIGTFLSKLTKDEPNCDICVIVADHDLDRMKVDWKDVPITVLEDIAGMVSPPLTLRGVVMISPIALEKIEWLRSVSWDLVVFIEPETLFEEGGLSGCQYASELKARSRFALFHSDPDDWGAEMGKAMLGLVHSSAKVMEWTIRRPDVSVGPPPSQLIKNGDLPAAKAMAEIIIDEGPSKGLPIPLRSVGPGPTPPPEEAQVRLRISGPYDDFIKEAKRLADHAEPSAIFVPFSRYWPTYASMTDEQRRWYFYWRGQVRCGKYPDTDLSYVFVYIYELINRVGWTNADDGFNALLSIWNAYRPVFPRLDGYMVSWSLDFYVLNRCSSSLERVFSESPTIFKGEGMLDLYLTKQDMNKPLIIPFEGVEALINYRIRSSSFYSGGNQSLVNEAVPKTISAVDLFFRKKSGKGILETYGPGSVRTIVRSAYPSAIYGYQKVRYSLEVVPYSGYQPLRDFLTHVVKYSENTLREMRGFKGRLRGIKLDKAVIEFIDQFLHRFYCQDDKGGQSKAVVLDMGRVKELMGETKDVQEMLSSNGSEALEVETCDPSSALVSCEGQNQSEGTPIKWMADVVQLELDGEELSVLRILGGNGWTQKVDELARALPGVLVHNVISSINVKANDQLDDLLLVEVDSTVIVQEEYRQMVEGLLGYDPEERARTAPIRVDTTGFQEEWKKFFDGLKEQHVQALTAIVWSGEQDKDLLSISRDHSTMPETIIDEINEASMEAIGDLLIDVDSDPLSISPEYQGAIIDALAPLKEKFDE